MSKILNPDPHKDGYRFAPIHRVTAIFRTPVEIDNIRDDLRSAGLKDEDMEFFVGQEGAARLDLNGRRHGRIISLLRKLQLATADEENLYREFDEIVREGGAAVDVFVDADDERKHRAAEILRQHGAHDVCYWGSWTVEEL
jgi:hypothetical protein